MDDLLADFVAETREMLEAIEGELVAWEADPADRARLDAIFRFVHTVKGNCGFFDFPRLESLSHAAEGALAEVRAGRRPAESRLVTAVLAIIDRITEMTNAIEAGEDLSDGDDAVLIAALEPDSLLADEIATAGAAGAFRASDPGASALRSIRLPVELLDRVMSGVSDMVLARNDLARRLREAGNEPTLDGPFERLTAILTDVREAITRMRMQRIETLYNALPRLVRDLSSELGKQVMVDFEGGDVELDREMIETIRDPVTHLIRNAIDHGIEKPSVRLAAGKREIGMLAIAARQSGNKITITISDDGKGLDHARIGHKAIEAGLVTQAELESMSPANMTELIFEPGLSTADAVSAVSGRGVGMDVVRANLEKIGGSIRVSSQIGEGTLFFLEIPLTLSIVPALTVATGGLRFAIPQSYVEEIAHGASASVQFSRVGATDLVTFRDRRLPCLTLNNVLAVNPRNAGSDQRLVVLRLGNGDLFALAVDRILDQEDLVIKPLAPAVMHTGLYAGTTLLDDGSPVLMLDVPGIAARHGLLSDVRLRPSQAVLEERGASAEPVRSLMTFTGYDGRRKAIAMDLVTRIEQLPAEAFVAHEGNCQVVIDGRIITVIGFDPAQAGDEPVKLLRLSDSVGELAYAVTELGETSDVAAALTAVVDDPEHEGMALIDNRPVPVVDGYRLFALHGSAPQEATRPGCRLPQGDEWAERMLAPLILSAGYRLVTDADEAAEVVITIEGSDPAGLVTSESRVISISREMDGGAGDGGSLYRYDREGLVAALRQARGGKA